MNAKVGSVPAAVVAMPQRGFNASIAARKRPMRQRPPLRIGWKTQKSEGKLLKVKQLEARMSEIRERIEAEIEALDAYDYKSEAFIYANHVGAGNLVPKDEHEAAVAEAVRKERERCAKIADEGERADVEGGIAAWIAAAIRKEPDHD